jgi:hypothetical protein
MGKLYKINTEEEFQLNLTGAVDAILKQVEKHMGDKEWIKAYSDLRSTNGGKSSIGKFRIRLKDGTEVRSLHSPDAVDLFVQAAWDGNLFPTKWAGIKITVLPDGKCEVKYNYDSDFANDPNFYDVE